MNKFTHFFATLSLLLCMAVTAMAQSNGNAGATNTSKFYTQFGISPFLGYEQSPTSSYTTYSAAGYSTPYGKQQVSLNIGNYEIISFIYRIRMNIKEYNNNSSLSVSVLPAIGLSTTVNNLSQGFGSINIPVFFEYNSGNVATYTADKDKGLVLGVGIEYFNAPLIAGAYQVWNENNQPVNATITESWVEPVVEIGYRHWNKRNKAKEINFKAGFGANGAFSLRFSWMKCIGY